MRTTEGQLQHSEALDDEKLIAMYNQQLIVKRAHEEKTCTHAADAKRDRDRAFTSLLDDLADAYRAGGKYRDAMRWSEYKLIVAVRPGMLVQDWREGCGALHRNVRRPGDQLSAMHTVLSVL